MRLSDWSSDVCSSDLFKQVFQVKLSARDVFTCPTLGSLAELAASRCTAPESKKKSDDLVAAAAVGEPGPLPTAPRASLSPLPERQHGLALLHPPAPHMGPHTVPVALGAGGGLDVGLFRQGRARQPRTA